MKKGYKLCPYCGEEIKEIAKKCRFCGEFLEERKLETNGRIKEEIKKSQSNKKVDKEWNYDLCFYCQKNKPNSNCSKTIKLSHVVTNIPLLVARYVKIEGTNVVIPRCSECYEKQQKDIKKSAYKCFGIAFIIALLLGILSYSAQGSIFVCLLSIILYTAFIGGIAFLLSYPKSSGSFKLSERPERKKLKEDGWQMEA